MPSFPSRNKTLIIVAKNYAKRPNTKFFLVCIFTHSDHKKTPHYDFDWFLYSVPLYFFGLTGNPAYIYFKVNNGNTRKRWEISSKLTIKTPERHHWRRSGFFIVNFEHISHLFQVFLLLTLNKEMLAGNLIKFHKFLLICQRST